MLSKIQELLAVAENKTAEVRQREYLARCRKEFVAIRVDAHKIAHEICDARAQHAEMLDLLAFEGKRLGGWAAEIRAAKSEMEAKQAKLRLDDPGVKEEWDQAVAILRHEANAYASETDAREARKTAAQNILDQAYLDMRLRRGEIIDRVAELHPWLHSEEESNRRAAIKAAKIEEIMDRQMLDQAEAHEAQERLNLYLFGMQVAEYISMIGAKLDIVLPSLVAENETQTKKEVFVTKMKEAKAAKKNRAINEIAAVEAKRLAEEAELQRLIEEEVAAKLTEENKAKAAFFLAQIEQADNLEDVTAYAMAAHEFDATVNAALIVNEAAARFNTIEIQESKRAAKKVEVCHVKPLKLHAKERRELDRQGVRGKNWAVVPVEEM
jgi:hypothetical protein